MAIHNNSQVLTSQGWKKASDVAKKEAKVCVVNIDSDNLGLSVDWTDDYTVSISKYKSKFMYRLQDNLSKLDFMVTDGHKIILQNKNLDGYTETTTDVASYSNSHLPISANTYGSRKNLTNQEKLNIIFYARGIEDHWVEGTTQCIGVKKPIYEKEILPILKEENIGHIFRSDRLYFKIGYSVSRLIDSPGFEDLSVEFCHKYILYVNRWLIDGKHHSILGLNYCQGLAAISGWCLHAEDDLSFSLSKTNIIHKSKIKSTIKDIEDRIFNVKTDGKSYIIVRQNKKYCIIGTT